MSHALPAVLSLNTVLSGVLKATGHQAAGFLVNLATLWLLGVPLAAGLDLKLGWGPKVCVDVYMLLAVQIMPSLAFFQMHCTRQLASDFPEIEECADGDLLSAQHDN